MTNGSLGLPRRGDTPKVAVQTSRERGPWALGTGDGPLSRRQAAGPVCPRRGSTAVPCEGRGGREARHRETAMSGGRGLLERGGCGTGRPVPCPSQAQIWQRLGPPLALLPPACPYGPVCGKAPPSPGLARPPRTAATPLRIHVGGCGAQGCAMGGARGPCSGRGCAVGDCGGGAKRCAPSAPGPPTGRAAALRRCSVRRRRRCGGGAS